jgi:hypothetical protein
MTAFMAVTMLFAPVLILLALMLFVLMGVESGVRRLGVFALVGAAVACGMLVEKGLFVNRHIALCADDTAAYYREFNRFDPYCEVLTRGR